MFSFSFSVRCTVLYPSEAWFCYRERHARASWKEKKCVFCFFTRGTILLPREGRPYLSEREKCAFCSFFCEMHGLKGKNTFSPLSFFRKRHGFVFARGTIHAFRKGKKNCFLFFLSRVPRFFRLVLSPIFS